LILQLSPQLMFLKKSVEPVHLVMPNSVEGIKMRGLIRTGLVLTALGGVSVGIISLWSIGTPEKLGMLTGDAMKGAYLARSSGCVTCHTDIANAGRALAGGAPLDTPFGSFIPPNITPDFAAGIGGWSLDQFAKAVRQGINPEGKAYYPAFPYEFYAEFSDQDIADLWAAINAVPTVETAAAPHDVGFPFNQRWGLKLWRAAFMSPVEMSPVFGQSNEWNRGQQLVQGAAHCAACHTSRNLLGGLQADKAFSGNKKLPGGSAAPSIRAADLIAAGWTTKNLDYALRTGIMPNGDVLGGSMAEVVQAGTSFLTDEDRMAIASYLLNARDGERVSVDAMDAPTEEAVLEHTPGMVMP
jgi:mono/diheme cytochrome c family protein